MQSDGSTASIRPSLTPEYFAANQPSPVTDAVAKPKPIVHRGHLLVIAALVALADLALYQGGGGLAGWAAWCATASLLVFAGVNISKSVRIGPAVVAMAVSLLLTASRLVWQGSLGLAIISIFQLLIFALLLHDVSVSVMVFSRFLLSWLPQGCRCIPAAVFSTSGLSVSRWRWLEYGLPILVTTVFASIFLMANPDAVTQFVSRMSDLFSMAATWLQGLRPGQSILWLVVTVLGLGVIAPPWKEWLQTRAHTIADRETSTDEAKPTGDERGYRASRNTLVAVIVLFVAYLTAEFSTMWFREFPEGFQYSGYAHAGAAWLTAALALATVVVSAIFRPSLGQAYPSYQRRGNLLRLAWIWSVLNFVLAICVLNRLFIYIGYNGMTRMRVVAILGVCCVAAGFAWVMIKSKRGHSFVWLVERQVLTLALFMYLLAVMPVDWLVYTYNCQKILGGKQSPAVQLTAHQLSSGALQATLPLIESDNQLVSDGVAALVAQRLEEIQATKGWQQFQFADRLLQNSVTDRYLARVEPFLGDTASRGTAITRFKDAFWKWY